MRPTLSDNRADIVDLFASMASAGVTVYDHEPTGEVEGPVFVTVSYDGVPVTPTEITATVRIYSQAGDDPGGAEVRLADALDAAESCLDTTSSWLAPSWVVDFTGEPLFSWVATAQLVRGREDLCG